MNNKGLVHIYTGDGKGKTSSAMGIAIRCAGHGKRVRVFQFLKATTTGEINSLKNLGIDVIRVNTCGKFFFEMDDEEKRTSKKEVKEALKLLFEVPCDMIVLDEIICTVNNHIIDVETLTDIIKNKPLKTEIVMTGRNAPEKLLSYADYVSEIKCVKHPFEKGIEARCGIDF